MTLQERHCINGNPEAEFDINLLTAFAVEVKKCTSQKGQVHKSECTSQTATATSQTSKGHKSEGTSQTLKGHKSDSEEKRPFGKNILTLKERVADFCSEPKSMHEIADFLGVKDKRKARGLVALGRVGLKGRYCVSVEVYDK